MKTWLKTSADNDFAALIKIYAYTYDKYMYKMIIS